MVIGHESSHWLIGVWSGILYRIDVLTVWLIAGHIDGREMATL